MSRTTRAACLLACLALAGSLQAANAAHIYTGELRACLQVFVVNLHGPACVFTGQPVNC